jgi:hypothetical protein
VHFKDFKRDILRRFTSKTPAFHVQNIRMASRAISAIVLLSLTSITQCAIKTINYQECYCTSFDLASAECQTWTCQPYIVCFPRGALLRQGDAGDSVKMHSLTIGSKIVGANGTNPAGLFVGHSARSRLPFSPAGQLDTVTNFIHRDENIKSTFLRLQTPRGALELSPNHLLFARNGSSTQSVLARDVRIGTTLLHRDGEAMVIDPYTPGCCAHMVAAQLAACGR